MTKQKEQKWDEVVAAHHAYREACDQDAEPMLKEFYKRLGLAQQRWKM